MCVYIYIYGSFSEAVYHIGSLFEICISEQPFIAMWIFWFHVVANWCERYFRSNLVPVLIITYILGIDVTELLTENYLTDLWHLQYNKQSTINMVEHKLNE